MVPRSSALDEASLHTGEYAGTQAHALTRPSPLGSPSAPSHYVGGQEVTVETDGPSLYQNLKTRLFTVVFFAHRSDATFLPDPCPHSHLQCPDLSLPRGEDSLFSLLREPGQVPPRDLL